MVSETEKPGAADIPDGDQGAPAVGSTTSADAEPAASNSGTDGTPANAGNRRSLLIGVSAVAVIATVLAIVFGVLWGQQSSKADKNASTATALQNRQDGYAKAIAVATEFAVTRTTTPADGNWAGWQTKMRSLVGPELQDRYSDANVAKVKAVNLHTVTTVPYAGVTSARDGSCDILLVTRTTDATRAQAGSVSAVQVLTVDIATSRVVKINPVA